MLTPQAVDKLFVVLRQLASEDCSILYISHKLHEIRALCTRCTVLRAGRVTGECDPRLESNASLSQRMIGAEPPTLQRQRQKSGAVVMQVVDLHVPRSEPFGVDIHGVNFSLRAGEVLGIAGVSGNGQRELVEVLAGQREAESGDIVVAGQPYRRGRSEMRAVQVGAQAVESPQRFLCP